MLVSTQAVVELHLQKQHRNRQMLYNNNPQDKEQKELAKAYERQLKQIKSKNVKGIKPTTHY
jgi:hypothetical protein